ncbi:GUN4 domain-containing protein [Aphanizomenon flos-aquae NRERC-008]|uniref:GUN4 domain-containing protein n=5 Tax=Aphanizomenon TaxID=1175 RepID=A0ABR8INN0_APHFL|nr:GUN4 domain-containing protein [Aphanizomenon flos-aquae]MBD2391952.1 GUN4 domain-containing protein [Aphanizomenon flos-aquae FACHB-1171]MBD2658526.1 GUN4 domain-containing protein [Aphanizomenon flos-aquae FACHB-1265]MBD2684086.1 GUN4 domain-containing protein [Aphanizomenon flos-aquae FACHB-1249]MBD2698383.1 GUN4 domain-containing protein [Aphanizomenon flos-aquae FACHB-1287]MDS9396072.1 GUN4 domain-containing protein [Aphanizomenon flos-aquae NRERC-008]
MPIINRDEWPDSVFFSPNNFLELGTRNTGEKIIQIGTDGDCPIVAFANTDNPINEDLDPIELWSLIKFSYVPDEYVFYDKPKKITQNLKTIKKCELPDSGEFDLDLPIDAQILAVQMQKDKPCLWMLIDSQKEKDDIYGKKRTFCWFRTGEPIGYTDLIHIATLQSNGGNHVSHLFELKNYVNYNKLENLLATKKWREADLETFEILKSLCGYECYDSTWLNIEEIVNIPCSHLHTINNLWVKYSKGRFGYSVQLNILRKLGFQKNGNDEQMSQCLENFMDKIKWNTAHAALNFTLKAPIGHLPAIVAWGMVTSPQGAIKIYIRLFSRCEECNL